MARPDATSGSPHAYAIKKEKGGPEGMDRPFPDTPIIGHKEVRGLAVGDPNLPQQI